MTTAAQPGSQALDRALLHGIAWTGVVRWGAQILSWASTLIVARLLAPSDYGLMGMAMVYVGFIQLLNTFGLGSAIVQRRDLSAEQIARLGGLALLGGAAFVLLSFFAAGLVAAVFGEPAVRSIVVVSSVTFLIGAAQIVPRALLNRDLEFRRVAWADGGEAMVTTATTLALAALGSGYWALVIGPLAGRGASTCLLNVWRPHRIAWPRPFSSIAGAVTFGWQVVVAGVAWYVYDNADFAVVGRVLGSSALGAYTVGWTVASIPIERVSALVGSVTPAVLSSVQEDRLALQRYLRNLTQGLAFITFPAAIGIALVADEFVLFALGERWRAAIAPLRLLAISAALRSVSTPLPQLAVATGHAKRNMHLTIIAALILPALFYFGTRWGTAGVAAVWLLGHPTIVMPLFLFHALKLTRMRLPQYLQSLATPTWATLAMSAAVLADRWATPESWPLVARLASQVALGVGVYGAVLYATGSAHLRALWGLLRPVSAKGVAP